jgi:acyl-CoA synthetase (AMP-forming)/AMP-acid ligase II
MLGKARSFVEVVLARAAADPDRVAYRFLGSGADDDGVALTYAGLDRRARAIAAKVQEISRPGDRVLLLYPPGLDFVTAFIGCLYARAIAVPLYPPHPGRLDRARALLAATVADAEPAALLTVPSVHRILATGTPPIADPSWFPILTTEGEDEDGSAWRPGELSARTPALLQYTSGSTSAPKGVVVTHGNLLHNCSMIQQAFDVDADACGVIWLPPYHDMGLVGGVLEPVYSGLPVVLMSPFTFLQRPARWVEAISRWHATASGGPNFAYELVVSRTTPEQRNALDLRSWRVAFTGSEPIRADTLDRFAEAFGPAGFRREAFYPCYGLAEGTLMITGGLASEPPAVLSVDAAMLQQRRAVIVNPSAAGSRRLVSCGVARLDQEIRIVNPETLIECPAGEVGEIWARGPSIAPGYWNRQSETTAAFGGRIAGTDEDSFLRTGDLGFVHAGELFVTGRLKHLIIIDGRNHYPHDIERTTEASHPGIRTAGAAAFTIDDEGLEQLVIAVEVDRQFARRKEPDRPLRSEQDCVPSEPIVKAVRLAVAREHDIRIHDVIVLPPGGLPRTSSGKIQHHLCRRAYETHAFPALQA